MEREEGIEKVRGREKRSTNVEDMGARGRSVGCSSVIG
jgi:hypothetical protein